MSALCQKRTFCNAAETGAIRSPHRRETTMIVALKGRARLGGLKIDDKLILRRCLNREVRRLLALEDAINVASRPAVLFVNIRPIGD
jgi:hypothetical protein